MPRRITNGLVNCSQKHFQTCALPHAACQFAEIRAVLAEIRILFFFLSSIFMFILMFECTDAWFVARGCSCVLRAKYNPCPRPTARLPWLVRILPFVPFVCLLRLHECQRHLGQRRGTGPKNRRAPPGKCLPAYSQRPYQRQCKMGWDPRTPCCTECRRYPFPRPIVRPWAHDVFNYTVFLYFLLLSICRCC